MQNDREDTPSGNPPTSPAEFALETLEKTCLELGYGFRARREVLRGLSGAERDAGLIREADHARDAKHLIAEAETILRALVGYRSEQALTAIPAKPSTLTRWKSVGIAATAIATLLGALAAVWDSVAGHHKP